MPDLVVFRLDQHPSVDMIKRASEWAKELTAKLAESDRDVPIIVAPGVTIYYLRPGESTDLLDAKAEAIRSGVAVEA